MSSFLTSQFFNPANFMTITFKFLPHTVPNIQSTGPLDQLTSIGYAHIELTSKTCSYMYLKSDHVIYINNTSTRVTTLLTLLKMLKSEVLDVHIVRQNISKYHFSIPSPQQPFLRKCLLQAWLWISTSWYYEMINVKICSKIKFQYIK
jgi:hypothetical protein